MVDPEKAREAEPKVSRLVVTGMDRVLPFQHLKIAKRLNRGGRGVRSPADRMGMRVDTGMAQ